MTQQIYSVMSTNAKLVKLSQDVILLHLLGVRPRHGQQIVRDPVRVDSRQGGLRWTPTGLRNCQTWSVFLRSSPFCTFILAAPPPAKHATLHLDWSVPPQTVTKRQCSWAPPMSCLSLSLVQQVTENKYECFMKGFFSVTRSRRLSPLVSFGFPGDTAILGP